MGSYPEHLRPLCPTCNKERIRSRTSTQCPTCYHRSRAAAPTPAPIEAVADEPKPNSRFDERWDLFNRWIGRTVTEIEPCTSATKPDNEYRIVHLTDLHVPWTHERALQWAVEQTSGADLCVCGGDFFNAGAASRFIERKWLAPEEEFARATVVLQYLCEHYQKVRLCPGNHHDRLMKYFYNHQIAPYMMFLVNTEPLKFLARGFPNVEVATPLVADLETSDWVSIIGDCAFTHAETQSSVNMRPAENVSKFLRRWRAVTGQEPRVICQEHNHCGGMAPWRDEPSVMLIHTPCLSQNVGYQFEPSIKYGPNQLGYTEIVQVDGVTDWNRSRYYLAPADVVKEAA